MPHPSFSRPLLAERARLSAEDRTRVLDHRRPHTRLGFAYQLAFLRLTGRLPRQKPLEIAPDLLHVVALQLGDSVGGDPERASEELGRYAQRQPTISAHAEEIKAYLGYRAFEGADEQAALRAHLETEVEHLEQTSALVAKAEDYLRREKVLLPAVSTLRRLAQHVRGAFRRRLYARLAGQLSEEHEARLDALLETPGEYPSEDGASALQSLREPPGMASPRAFKAEAAKLERIDETGIEGVDLSWIRGSLRKALARRALRSDAHRLRELKAPHRYAALACFLQELRAETIDTLVEMHAKLMTGTYRRAKSELDDQLRAHRRQVLATLQSFRSMARLVLDEDVADEDLRASILEHTPAERLEAELAHAEEHLSGPKSDVFPFVTRRYSYLRRFAPTLLGTLDLKAEPTGDGRRDASGRPGAEGLAGAEDLGGSGTENDLIVATRILRRMNEEGRRKVPEDAPTSFLKKKDRPFVLAEGGDLDRAGYECAVLTAVRDEIKRGNLYVAGSRRYRRLGEFFMPDEQWESVRADFFARSGLPADSEAAVSHLKARLGGSYDRFLTSLPRNAYVDFDEGGRWHFGSDPAESLSAEDEQHLGRLTTWLEKRVRHVKLPDLLIEVDNDLRFMRPFLPRGAPSGGHPSGGRPSEGGGGSEARGTDAQARTPEAVCQAVAVVIAYGCNLGPVAMARLTKGVTYPQIKRIADWHLHEEALRAALAEVTDGIAGLDTARVWGEGTSSSSDGQRFIFPRKTVKRTYSHRLSDYALEFYSFIADNYAPFYSTPTECDERDAAYVLDGLLYHESDLDPEEHYTDTHGYTECNFAAFALLGRRFCPRIKGLKKQRIYRTEAAEAYGPLRGVLAGRDRQIHFDWIEAEWDRIAWLVASFAYGHATASVVMQRLVSFGTGNRLYRATRELGRIFKTEFVLEYLRAPELRRRVRRGLLKSEELHGLARSVFYGKLGRADWRDFRRQTSSASCLMLIMAAIIYWQIREIERVIGEADVREVEGLRLDLLSHVSPIGWENVTLYGQYVLRPGLVRV